MNNVGYQFKKWSGLSSSVSNVTKINLLHNGALIAQFKQVSSPLENIIYEYLDPSNFLILLFWIVVGSTGSLIIRWRRNRSKKDKEKYIRMIEKCEKCLKCLYELEQKFTELFIKGRMGFSLYQEMNNKVF